jgi:hypothetical protein
MGGEGGGSIAKAAVPMTSIKTAGILFAIGMLIARFNLLEYPTTRCWWKANFSCMDYCHGSASRR